MLVTFLRHAGCTFCREALADLQSQRNEIESRGARIALVHLGSEALAQKFFAHYGLGDVSRIGDPERRLYRAFHLRRGGLLDLFGPHVIRRGFEASPATSRGRRLTRWTVRQ